MAVSFWRRSVARSVLILLILAVGSSLIGSPLISAQAGGSRLADLAWLEGTWVDEGGDGSITEVIWSRQIGDAMVGTGERSRTGKCRPTKY